MSKGVGEEVRDITETNGQTGKEKIEIEREGERESERESERQRERESERQRERGRERRVLL